MNVILPTKEKGRRKRAIIYAIIILLCVIAVSLAMYQFFADEKLEVILGLVKAENEEIENLKTEFDGLFENKMLKEEKIDGIKKANNDKDLIYCSYEKKESVPNNYDIDVHIPHINIENSVINKYNNEIKKIFESNAEIILNTENRNIVYTVNYMASVENNILTVAILSTFKDGNNVQRTIIKTYNYDLKNNEAVSLKDLLKLKNITQNDADSTIKREISRAQEQANSLQDLGYTIYSRDMSSDMYKSENAKDFFMYDGYIYIIYAYGNDKNTSETDIVIM